MVLPFVQVKQNPSSEYFDKRRPGCSFTFFIPYIIVVAVMIYFTVQMKQLEQRASPEELESYDNDERRLFVKEMARDAWKAYVRSAWGQDALEPLTRSANQNFLGPNGGLTIFESLSTLYIMDFKNEYMQATKWIANEFNFSTINQPVNVFVIVTEVIGSLLSNYALTGNKIFLSKAHQIGRMLAPAYETPFGLPYKMYNPYTQEVTISELLLGEAGGQFLEYKFLANASGDSEIGRRIDAIRDFFELIDKPNGLYLSSLNSTTGKWNSDRSTLYSAGSTFYSYLIKAFIQSGGQDVQSLQSYVDAVYEIERNGLVGSPGGSMLFVHDYDIVTREYSEFMQTDSCYLGAMFALGADAQQNSVQWNYNGGEAPHHLQMAQNITETCHSMSNMTRTGLPPALVFFRKIQPTQAITYKHFYLTSELAESYFIMWRLTHNSKYREYSWELAQALWRHARDDGAGGFSNIYNVNQVPTKKTNYQPPQFLGATLKYLYLTFSDDSVLPLSQWIFNRAGQPLPIYAHN